MKKTYNTYKKSGVNMATADKLVNYISKISRKTYKKNIKRDIIYSTGTFEIPYIISKNMKKYDELLQ